MATFYGSSSVAPGVTPSVVDSGWSRTSAGLLRKAAVLTDASAAATWSDSSQASVHSSALGQWIYGPIAAQTIGGTCTIVVYGKSNTFSNLYTGAAAIWIATAAGALRATLLAKYVDSQQWTTTMQAFNFGAVALTSQAASYGDYLVFEGGLDDSTFINADVGSIGAGNSRTRFSMSQQIQLVSPTTNPSVVWLGKPQPKRN